ncbi:MAG: hypothetical protein IJZ82_12235 [Lachnospiraceae bacterium]|nr:hypothetical protein [Lachnospiraceae bacterium]
MKKKSIITIVLLICCLLLGCTGLLVFHLRGSVKILATNNYMVNEHVVLYRQDSSEWANDYLGTSTYTMKSSGCLVTCIAVAISNDGRNITPGELNQLFSKENMYDTEGNLQWERLKNLENFSVQVYNGVSAEDISSCLEEGHFPIVRVRMKGWGSFHYVLIVGSENGDYICVDPLEDELTTLSDYNNRIYAIRCVWEE